MRLSLIFIFFLPVLNIENTLNSGFEGRVLARTGHDYGPSILLIDGIYHMWWCGSPIKEGTWDAIWYATSSNGLDWTCPPNIAIEPSDTGLDKSATCDPSVVKVSNVFYLYYTGINTDVDTNNRIFLATSESAGGPWEKYPNNSYPVAILEDPICNPKELGDYCVGQSTVIYLNDEFYQWYTDSGKGSGHSPSPLPTMLAKSTDGIHFHVENENKPVFQHADTSVKYDDVSHSFLMVYGNVDDAYLYWTYSLDGLLWADHSPNRKIQVNDWTNKQNHNPGMAGDEHGHFQANTFVMYGAGSTWGVWDLDRSDIIYNIPQSSVPTCAACVHNNDCSAACGEAAYCAHPGSLDQKDCCICVGECKVPNIWKYVWIALGITLGLCVIELVVVVVFIWK